MGGVLQKKGTYRGHHLPWRKRKRKKKRCRVSYSRTLTDSLMVSPPTLQRHELAKSIHATLLYPTSFLPADTRYIRIWYIIRTSLKPRLVEHTRRLFFVDVAIRNSLRSNKKTIKLLRAPIVGKHNSTRVDEGRKS